ncbi:MAG: hypothetical protein LBB72_07080 [Spirochaetaceae bacterium]|nr:hypothetical protein [Spirochaetaceae bacterium]
MTDGKKDSKPGQLEGSNKTFKGFDVQTNKAAFPCAAMIMLTGDQGFGGKGRKGNTGRQDEEQCFPFGAQFHYGYIVSLFRAFWQAA